MTTTYEVLTQYNIESKTYESMFAIFKTFYTIQDKSMAQVLTKIGLNLSVYDEDLEKRVPLYKLEPIDSLTPSQLDEIVSVYLVEVDEYGENTVTLVDKTEEPYIIGEVEYALGLALNKRNALAYAKSVVSNMTQSEIDEAIKEILWAEVN